MVKGPLLVNSLEPPAKESTFSWNAAEVQLQLKIAITLVIIENFKVADKVVYTK